MEAELKTKSPEDIRTLAKHYQITYSGEKPPQGIYKRLAREIGARDTRSKCAHYKKKLSEATLREVRSKIYNEFKRFHDSVYAMTSSDLFNLFKAYDKYCFNGDMMRYMNNDVDFTLTFRTEGEYTFTTEGSCIRKRCNYIMTFPVEKFKNIRPGVKTTVAGHACSDQLECLQRVMEHELCHLIVFIFCGDPLLTDQHGELFMSIVHDLFRHTSPNHHIF